jgi:membrane protease YdiL (CAAX protease family)
VAKRGGKEVKSVESTGFGVREYLRDSSDLMMSIVLVLPLFVFYQIGVLATGGVRNGVDFVTNVLFALTNGNTLYYILFNLAVLIAFGVALFVLRNRGTLQPKIIPFMLLESGLYALFFGGAVVKLMSVFGMDALLSAGGQEAGAFTNLIMSIGAGLYEEIVFRLILVGGLYLLGTRVAKIPKWGAAVGAVVLSSLAFSAVHHIGALGDPFTLGTFVFRFFAGVLLAVIYYARGFAIAVYTHAIYDIFVLVLP